MMGKGFAPGRAFQVDLHCQRISTLRKSQHSTLLLQSAPTTKRSESTIRYQSAAADVTVVAFASHLVPVFPHPERRRVKYRYPGRWPESGVHLAPGECGQTRPRLQRAGFRVHCSKK